MLELSLGDGAAGGVLAHTHGRVALVHLAHLALLAVVVQAGIFKIKAHTVRNECLNVEEANTSLRLLKP